MIIFRWLVHLFVAALTVRVSDLGGGEHVEPRLLYRWVLLGVWWAWRGRMIFVTAMTAILGLLLAVAFAWLVGILR